MLRRLPVQASYNLTILDRRGATATVYIAPDRPPAIAAASVATNHQHGVEWKEHARVTGSVEREERMLALLDDPATAEARFLEAFLEPPLHRDTYGDGFGTLYTAVHRLAAGAVEYRWPGVRWRQALDAFEEGSVTVRLPGSKASKDCAQA